APRTSELPATADRPHHLVTISARTADAFRQLAARWADHLAASQDALADVAFAANAGRAHFAHRAAIIADSPAALGQALTALAERGTAAAIGAAVVQDGATPPVAVVFDDDAFEGS